MRTCPEAHSLASFKTRYELGFGEEAASAPWRWGISQDKMPETWRMLALPPARLQASTVSQRKPNLNIVYGARAGPRAKQGRTKPSVGDASPSQSTPSQTPWAAPRGSHRGHYLSSEVCGEGLNGHLRAGSGMTW